MKESKIQNIKLWIYLYKEDVFQICMGATFLIFILSLPSLGRKYILSKLDTKIVGVVENIEKNQAIHNSQYGGKVYVKSYTVDYQFFIDKMEVCKREWIEKRTLTTNQRIAIYNLKSGDSLSIRYDSKNIQNAKIDLRLRDSLK